MSGEQECGPSEVEAEAEASVSNPDIAVEVEDVSALPEQLRNIGASVATVLAELDAVLARKRVSILDLARAGGSSEVEAMAERQVEVEREIERVESDSGDANAPAAMLASAAVHSVGLAMQNTVAASQQLDIIAQAVVTRAATELLDASEP